MLKAKHAYLIIAHNNYEQLKELIALLDHPLNDLYIHIDKKAKNLRLEDFNLMHSELNLINRIKVNWGGHSQIQCELNLLKAAVPKQYQYYHLISGVDLPLKTQDEIHAFFDNHYPNSFIEFDTLANETGSFLCRIEQFHIFQDIIGRNIGLNFSLLHKLETILLIIQKKLGVKRKQYIKAYKGTNWFSITHDIAQYVINQEKKNKKQFYYSICADEVFLHSIIMNSPYVDDIINDSLREIDWNRGNPYTFRLEDAPKLLESPNLFARKFDSTIDKDVIEKIIEYLSNKNNK